MDRRLFLTSALAGTAFTGVARAQSGFRQDVEAVAGAFAYYTDHARGFVIFEQSTCCLVDGDLSDQAAIVEATEILKEIIRFHPDFQTCKMDDGNVMVGYNHPAYNVVLVEAAKAALNDLEPNQLNLGLLGRSLMFMDAENPKPHRVVRATQ